MSAILRSGKASFPYLGMLGLLLTTIRFHTHFTPRFDLGRNQDAGHHCRASAQYENQHLPTHYVKWIMRTGSPPSRVSIREIDHRPRLKRPRWEWTIMVKAIVNMLERRTNNIRYGQTRFTKSAGCRWRTDGTGS